MSRFSVVLLRACASLLGYVVCIAVIAFLLAFNRGGDALSVALYGFAIAWAIGPGADDWAVLRAIARDVGMSD